MPRGTTREDFIVENLNAQPNVDVNVQIHIPRSPVAFDETKHKYKCSCCGKPFTKQNGNFQKSNDVLFQANDGYLPWCKECTDKYVNQLTALFSNNEELAMKDFCQRAGWNCDVNALKASMETYSGHRDRSRISHYAAKKNLNCGGRKTFIDTIKFDFLNRQKEVILSKEQAKADDIAVKASAIDRWGAGLTELDYKNLEEHYKMLKKNNPNCDNNQEIFVKALCNLNMLAMKALQNDDSDKYMKLTDQYAKTFKQAGLRTIEEKDASNDETFCMTLGFISDYTPEEFYKEQTLYQDYDKFGDYIERHITRPMMNLKTGDDVRDSEFFVPEVDEYEEE